LFLKKGCKVFRLPRREKTSLRAETASVVSKTALFQMRTCSERKARLYQFDGDFDGGRISIAALAVGIAQGAFESAVRYAQEQSSLVNLSPSFRQSNQLAMATQIDAARLMMYRAA
jgi:alkylation response protein AidB-like acyl-CoA dehydrogenase